LALPWITAAGAPAGGGFGVTNGQLERDKRLLKKLPLHPKHGS